MRVIGIDTSTALGALGLIDGAHTLFDQSMSVRPGGAERFPVLIKKALTNIGLTPENLDLVVVGAGPGSYTGVRVGITIAKGMAFALGLPMVGVSTLYGLAANASGRPGLICPLLNSRRDEVYAALYFRRETTLTEVFPAGAWSVGELCAYLQDQMASTPILFVGEAVVSARETISKALGAWAVFGEEQENLVNGTTLARLGLAKWERTNRNELYTCLPLYLKRTEAEVRLEERRGQGDPDRTDAPGRSGRGSND